MDWFLYGNGLRHERVNVNLYMTKEDDMKSDVDVLHSRCVFSRSLFLQKAPS